MGGKKIAFPGRVCSNCISWDPLQTFPVFGGCEKGYSSGGSDDKTDASYSCAEFAYSDDPALRRELVTYRDLTGKDVP